ncbi:unnamed protein product [Phytophthora lilii]|uniref:Unnamed protein product n=1 Tax=Phytophthora lilii TaxID=2077276 RepID=A0A9W6TYR3_9STRA|nr:unnamed protein product [Phytophthora lilii]
MTSMLFTSRTLSESNLSQSRVICSQANDSENRIKKLLTKYSFKNVDHYFDHFIVFDFEAILQSLSQQHGQHTSFDNQHIPVSVSVPDSLSNQTRCFVNNEPKALVEDIIGYINHVSNEISDWHKDKFKVVLMPIAD